MIKNGVYAASVSILNSNKSLDIKSTINHAENAIKMGLTGAFFFGSTGQSQLVSISEKKDLISRTANSKFKDKFYFGTGVNSLKDNLDLIRYCMEFGYQTFLIMPPAYYKGNTDKGVYDFYAEIIAQVPKIKIVLYNFEKLSGYLFSTDAVKNLVKNFPKQIIGCKDSSYNLFETLKIPDFKMFPGSEAKLLKGLELGCSGCISAITNVTHSLAKKVFDDFEKKMPQTVNEKVINVRQTFDQYPLISALHSFLSVEDKKYQNILPPLTLLDSKSKDELLNKLKELDFIPSKNIAA
ncbi:MAG: dihydrodipicolinate synthase family protein [Pelagibacteraceae bacterium]|jgi:4-hydroxy-tetrahydrodipicolinate synthase|nr:dihydrodipicolinate synthase family protein [Pelagibacteraceae bacterium]